MHMPQCYQCILKCGLNAATPPEYTNLYETWLPVIFRMWEDISVSAFLVGDHFHPKLIKLYIWSMQLDPCTSCQLNITCCFHTVLVNMVNFPLTAHDYVNYERSFDKNIHYHNIHPMICFKITHHEQWFHYKHILLVNLRWNLTLQLFSVCRHYFSQVVNIALLRKSPVHAWCSPVVNSIERNSPVVKWETPCSTIHMNTVWYTSAHNTWRDSAAICLFLDVYRVAVRENTPTNTIIIDTVHAVDIDQPPHNRLVYDLLTYNVGTGPVDAGLLCSVLNCPCCVLNRNVTIV